LQAYPRLDFAKVLLESIARVVREKPQTAALNFAADVGKRFIPAFKAPNFCDLVMSAPFRELHHHNIFSALGDDGTQSK
jgi:hypothetical protein